MGSAPGDRAELACELIAGLDGPADRDWESTWLAEIDGRVEDARQSGDVDDDWSDVRAGSRRAGMRHVLNVLALAIR